MIELKKVTDCILNTVEEFNKQASEDQQLERSVDTPLFGRESKLDSLGLVNFIVAAEQQILETFEESVSLADEKALSQKNSPFKTVSSLAQYAYELLKESE